MNSKSSNSRSSSSTTLLSIVLLYIILFSSFIFENRVLSEDCFYQGGATSRFSDISSWTCNVLWGTAKIKKTGVTVETNGTLAITPFLEIGNLDGSVNSTFLINSEGLQASSALVYYPSTMKIQNNYALTSSDIGFSRSFTGEFRIINSLFQLSSYYNISTPTCLTQFDDSVGIAGPFIINTGASFVVDNSTIKFRSGVNRIFTVGKQSNYKITNSKLNLPINITVDTANSFQVSNSEYYPGTLNAINSNLTFLDSQRIQFNNLTLSQSKLNIINTVSCFQQEYPDDLENGTFPFIPINGISVTSFSELSTAYIGLFNILPNSIFNIQNSTFIFSRASLSSNSSNINIKDSKLPFDNVEIKLSSSNMTFVNSVFSLVLSSINIQKSPLSFLNSTITINDKSSITSDSVLSVDGGSFTSEGALSFDTLVLTNSVNVIGSLEFNDITLTSSFLEMNSRFSSNGGVIKVIQSKLVDSNALNGELINNVTLSLSVSTLQVGTEPALYTDSVKLEMFNSTIHIPFNSSLQLANTNIVIKDVVNITTSRIVNEGSLAVNQGNYPKNLYIHNNGYLEFETDFEGQIRQAGNNDSAIRLNFNCSIKSEPRLNLFAGSIGGDGTIKSDLYIGSNSTLGANTTSRLVFEKTVQLENDSTLIIVIDSKFNFTHFNFTSVVSIPASHLLIKINREMFNENGTFTVMTFNTTDPSYAIFSIDHNHTNILIYDGNNHGAEEFAPPAECNVVPVAKEDRVYISFDQCNLNEKKLSGGAIAGIAVGCAVFVGCVGGTGYYLKKRRSQIAKENYKLRFGSQQVAESKV
ncbi:hypothetical protein DFA_07301 [Cavenderia fasciculata]|uniref:Transmembrane protein n=1 Tax=Cavenderia fasciculata TaxID=261658 RepID=F4PW17_CACFS|nr:uncharacterized protein DFA_07301 [Cavenderia fasciculata]EGG20181.1 hypothetical protein DFA_07301 [Cavenderia fasciculata]|eukprot:XP_004367164.1 hypothetical protein DFA_07301 [Cavenderia fasciculata]